MEADSPQKKQLQLHATLACMTPAKRTLIQWFCIVATFLTFVAIVGIGVFEAHIRWSLNQNFSLLDPGTLPCLVLLFGAELFALVWLLRSA